MVSAQTSRARSRALAGRRILVTRARPQAGKLSVKLRAVGATVIEIPSIEIRPPRSYQALDRALRNVTNYDWLILTSVNGVEALFRRLSKLRKKPKDLAKLKICAIGPATAEAIAQRGLNVDVIPEKYVAESVVDALASRVKGKHVLLVRATVARDVIPRELRAAGASVEVVEAYETVVSAASRARLGAVLKSARLRPDAITFTSSSTAKNFVELLRGRDSSTKLLDGVVLASIGPVTSATLRELGLRADVEATEYTMDGLVAALMNALTRK
jgi:uroporphyrinogen-III synthase